MCDGTRGEIHLIKKKKKTCKETLQSALSNICSGTSSAFQWQNRLRFISMSLFCQVDFAFMWWNEESHTLSEWAEESFCRCHSSTFACVKIVPPSMVDMDIIDSTIRKSTVCTIYDFWLQAWNLFWAVKQKRIYWEEGDQWITPRHQGSKLGEGQDLGAWGAGGMEKGVWYPILVRMGWLAVVAALLRLHIISLFLHHWLEMQSPMKACVCSSLDHRFTPGKGQSTAGSQKRSKCLCLSSQLTFTAGGEIIICGNQAEWKCGGNGYWVPRR